MTKYFFLIILLSVSLNLFAQNSEPEPVEIPLLYGSSNISIESFYTNYDNTDNATINHIPRLHQTKPYVGWHWQAPMSLSNATFCTEGMGTPANRTFDISGKLMENIGYMLRHQENTKKAYSIAQDYDPSTIKKDYNAFYQCEGCNNDPIKPKVFGFISDSVVINSYQYLDQADGKFKLNTTIANLPKEVLCNPWPQFLPSDQNIDMTNSSQPKYLPIFGRMEDEGKYGTMEKQIQMNLLMYNSLMIVSIFVFMEMVGLSRCICMMLMGMKLDYLE